MTPDTRALARAAELLAPHFDAVEAAEAPQELITSLYRLSDAARSLLDRIGVRAGYGRTVARLATIIVRAERVRKELGYRLLSVAHAQQEIIDVAALLQPEQLPRRSAA